MKWAAIWSMSFLLGATVLGNINQNTPLRIKVLLDYSANMHRLGPGNKPENKDYYVNVPAFQAWLDHFMTGQRAFDPEQLTLDLIAYDQDSHKNKSFFDSETDGDFKAKDAIPYGRRKGFVKGLGDNPAMHKNLAQATVNFEGVIWLITNHHMGLDAAKVRPFFDFLKNNQVIVTTYLYPVKLGPDDSRASGLVAYGLVVTPGKVTDQVKKKLGHTFKQLGSLFGETPPLQLFGNLEDLIHIQGVALDETYSYQGQPLDLELGINIDIANQTSLHTLSGGAVNVAMTEALRPTEETLAQWDLRALGIQMFQAETQPLARSVAPGKTLQLDTLVLRGEAPWQLQVASWGQRAKLGLSGGAISYQGQGILNGELEIRIKDEGKQLLQSVLVRQDVEDLIDMSPRLLQVEAHYFEVFLDIAIAPSRAWIMAVSAVFLILIGTLLALIGARKTWATVHIDGRETKVGLRAFGAFPIFVGMYQVAVLKRGLGTTIKLQAAEPLVKLRPDLQNGHFTLEREENGKTVTHHLQVGAKSLSAPIAGTQAVSNSTSAPNQDSPPDHFFDVD